MPLRRAAVVVGLTASVALAEDAATIVAQGGCPGCDLDRASLRAVEIASAVPTAWSVTGTVFTAAEAVTTGIAGAPLPLPP